MEEDKTMPPPPSISFPPALTRLRESWQDALIALSAYITDICHQTRFRTSRYSNLIVDLA